MKEQKEHLHIPKYRADIDGLRAIAVLFVVIFHAFPDWLEGGFIGVDIFFVISGFLISTIIFENLAKGTFSFVEFYARRVRRIFPALFLVLTASYAFGWFALLADEYKQLGKHIAAGTGFVSNFVLLGETGYFDNLAETKPLLHLWSLGIEEQFYIVWPLFLFLLWKHKANIFAVAAITALASFFLNLHGIKQDAEATFYLPQTRFWELLTGGLLAWIILNKNHFQTKLSDAIKDHSKTLGNLLSLLGFLLLAFGAWRINEHLNFPGKWALFPVLGASLIILAGNKAWFNRVILSNKLFVWFGLISYPLYLWHWPMLSFARIVESNTPSASTRLMAVFASILLAWLTYILIERPIRFGKQRQIKAVLLAILMVFLGFVGLTTQMNDGFDTRASIKNYANNKNELIRTSATDAGCFAYIGNDTPLFPYCRFTDAKAQETVAIIGDSHAHVVYPGIAEYLRSKGTNTVLFANSGCPPFLGVTTGENPKEKEECRLRIDQLINIVLAHNDIKKVFIVTRGPTYFTGREPVTGDKDLADGNIVPLDSYVQGLQATVKALTNGNKSVYILTENPELSYPAESCLTRPFKNEATDCAPQKAMVQKRQETYLTALNKLNGVTVINSLDTFCPGEKCLVFDDNGALLYADDDHLSVAGSRFQVEKLLYNYLTPKP